jgi:GntR family transcriptional regulator
MTARKLVRNPLYVQLQQILRELTTSDEFRVGDKFLTERQISERFDVSRVTANKALSNLVAEGVLSFRKGIGTFVEDATKDSNFPGVATSFTNKTLAAGRRPSTRVLRFARTTAGSLPAHATSRFPVSPGEEIAVAERLRLADDVPMILERHFFRLAVLPGWSEEDVRVSVYDSLTKKYRQKPSTVEETIRTAVVRGQDAALLGVPAGTPGFLMFFMARNQEEEPLYFAEVLYRGDAYEFHNRLGPIQKKHAAEEEPAEFTPG